MCLQNQISVIAVLVKEADEKYNTLCWSQKQTQSLFRSNEEMYNVHRLLLEKRPQVAVCVKYEKYAVTSARAKNNDQVNNVVRVYQTYAIYQLHVFPYLHVHRKYS